MENIIKVKNISYERYGELLLQKESLKKEAEQYQIQYNEIFNILNNDTYEAKMECVKKRKIVSYCKNLTELGSLIFRKDLEEYIEKAMQEYKDALNYIFKEDKITNEIKNNHEDRSKKIKTIYRQLARLIHPDMNSDLKDNKVIQDLWNRTCIAYNCSNLEEIEELEVLINRYLESINHYYIEIEIPNVDEKIFDLNREIEKIIHTNPYQYKYVISDRNMIVKKKEELLKELSDYKRYLNELNKQIEQFHIIEPGEEL